MLGKNTHISWRSWHHHGRQACGPRRFLWRIYAWEFEKRDRELKVRVDEQSVFNNIALRLNAGLAGLGLAYLTGSQVQPSTSTSLLVVVW
jgi:hypothetical protein